MRREDEPAVDEVAVDEVAVDEVAVEEPAVEEPPMDEVAVEELALEEVAWDWEEVVEEVRLEVPGKTVERRKVVSPALKSGLRKTKQKRSKKSPSPSSKVGNKRKRVSAPPSSNTSPVLKPPQKSNRSTRRAAGLIERLIE